MNITANKTPMMLCDLAFGILGSLDCRYIYPSSFGNLSDSDRISHILKEERSYWWSNWDCFLLIYICFSCIVTWFTFAPKRSIDFLSIKSTLVNLQSRCNEQKRNSKTLSARPEKSELDPNDFVNSLMFWLTESECNVLAGIRNFIDSDNVDRLIPIDQFESH